MSAAAAQTPPAPHHTAVAAASLAVAGVAVHIEAASGVLDERIGDWLARALLPADPPPLPQIPLRLGVATGEPAPPPAGVRELAGCAAWRVLRDDQRVFLRFPQAHCDLDLTAGAAMVWLADGWWREPLKTQQEPWLLSLLWLLRERGRYAFHASAVVRDGLGLLIAGDSGSGKSSTALSLIAAGWDWLADDVVLLEPDEPARLHGLLRGFAFHPALAERLPGLAGEAVGDKVFAEVEGRFPGRQVAYCRPVALLFPRVSGAATSRLEPLSSAEALMALLPASGGVLAGGGPRQAQAQLRALGQLVARVPAYRLHAARDIFARGKALEALLGASGVVQGARLSPSDPVPGIAD